MFLCLFTGISMRLIPLVICVSISGCIPYPAYKTLQPYAKAHVIDQYGGPVSGAKVSLISSAYPYGFEKSRAVSITRNGVAEFSKVKEFRIEAIGLHGAEFYFWNWCIEKDGYRTYSTHYGSSDGFDPKPIFKLESGSSSSCDAKSS